MTEKVRCSGAEAPRRLKAALHNLVFMTVVSGALAQTVPATPGPRLTLHDAEALALKNHPQVQAAQLNYQASQQAVAEARAAYYPSLQGDITGSQANPQARIGAGYLAVSRLWDRFSQGIILSQLITDSGRTRNLVASSRLQSQASAQSSQAPGAKRCSMLSMAATAPFLKPAW